MPSNLFWKSYLIRLPHFQQNETRKSLENLFRKPCIWQARNTYIMLLVALKHQFYEEAKP